MTNMNINPGGVIGGLLAAAGVIAFLALNQGNVPRHTGRLIGFAVIGGAFAGNWLWSAVAGAVAPSNPADSADVGSGDDPEAAAEEA